MHFNDTQLKRSSSHTRWTLYHTLKWVKGANLIYRYFHEKAMSRSAVQPWKWQLIGKGYWWYCTAHQAASKHTATPTNHTRPSSRKHSPDGATPTEVADIYLQLKLLFIYQPRKDEVLNACTCASFNMDIMTAQLTDVIPTSAKYQLLVQLYNMSAARATDLLQHSDELMIICRFNLWCVN